MVQIEQVVRRALQQGRIDIRTRNVEPRINVSVLLNKRSEVDGVIGQFFTLRFDLGGGLTRRAHLLGTLLLQMVHVEHVAAATDRDQQQHGNNALEYRGATLFARVVHMLSFHMLALRLLCHGISSPC